MIGHDDLAGRGLPPVAFVDNPGNALIANFTAVVAIRRGERGCFAVQTKFSAGELNAQYGVSEAPREAMLAGSMFGWDCKASFPATWRGRTADQV